MQGYRELVGDEYCKYGSNTGRAAKYLHSKSPADLSALLMAHYKRSYSPYTILYTALQYWLRKILRANYGIKIGNDKVQEVLHLHGRSGRGRKKKRKKWVRYEREHSMSLWHTDWYYLHDVKKWLIVYLDDASRKVMCYGIYDR